MVAHQILIIDDESALLRAFSRILEPVGYEVTTTDCGAEGLSLIASRRFDLVITDILMPTVEGVEICMVMKRSYPDVPVIAMSGCPARSTYLEMARLLGAKRVLNKPISSAELIDVIGSVLAS